MGMVRVSEAAIRAFSQGKVRTAEIHAALLEQQAQRNAGELGAGEQAVGVLHRGHPRASPFGASVAAAFDEVNPGHRRQPHEVIHRVDARFGDQSGMGRVDHQPVSPRVDVMPTVVMALIVQAGRRDDAEQPLERAVGSRVGAYRRNARQLAPLQRRWRCADGEP